MGQDRLVDGLVAEGVIRHRDVEQAMRAVDRAKFAGEGMNQRYCYQVRSCFFVVFGVCRPSPATAVPT
jgi:protein-L-isoaspartate O-methyltransferase